MARNKLVIDVEASTKLFDKQMDYIEARMIDIEAMIEDPKGFQLDAVGTAKLEKEYAQLNKQMSDIIRKKNELERSHLGENLANGFKKATKNATKLAIGIFGIRSAYNAVKRASSAYLSQDEELANKLQSVWVGLGSFLAPVIEKISNILLKALGYFNVFIKALTGVDYIANANAKALNKQAKAQANLNKQTQQYDFDVIRTQQDTSGGGGVSAETSGLINIPQLNEGLVKKLQNLAYWLKENKTLVEAVGVTLLYFFGAAVISKIVGGIASIIGVGGAGAAAGTGLAGLAGLLAFIALDAFVVTVVAKGIIETKKQVDELNKSLDNNTQLEKDHYNATKEKAHAYEEAVKKGEANTETTKYYSEILKKTREDILTRIQDLEDEKTIVGKFTGSNKRLTEQQKILAQHYGFTTTELEKLSNQGQIATEDFDDLENQLKNMTLSPYTINVILKTHEHYEGSSGFYHSGGGAHFATGGIVTQPTRALIGEAGYPEAVVPMQADYLSTLASEIAKFGGSGSGTVNVYLDGKLIQRQMAKVEDKKRFATNG